MSCKHLLFFILTGLFTSAEAQKWENPAERYKDAYRNYLKATCPISEDSIQHFVYFSRDRELLRDHPLCSLNMFKGAQIMYPWSALEPEKGVYDFSMIEEDLLYLKKHGKQLFIQLQDATFNPNNKAIPDYLFSEEYGGGAVLQYDDSEQPEGWVAKRWNKAVQERFALFLKALGKEFDGEIEGINLQETSIGVNSKTASDFTAQKYISGLKANMKALKTAFPTSTTMIYANFIPGEWLPWEDKGYLKSIYTYGNEIGVGLGAPDLMVKRKGQLNNPLAMMHEGEFRVPIGIAVQDGNYINKTGADSDYDEHKNSADSTRTNLVPLLHSFAKDFLKVNYIFWANQAPYFEQDVMPCFRNN